MPLPRALLLVLVLTIATHAGDEGVEPLTSRFEKIATLEVPVQEISGMAPTPDGDPRRRSFLVVTDEGGYDAEKKTVDGALYLVTFAFAEDGTSVTASEPKAVTLHLELERFDPGWPAHVSPLDLESVVRLPGTDDLYLLGGERNPEDQTDDGANRLYVVRYPDGGRDVARVVAYFRLFDLQDDLMNDRFEGVSAMAVEHDVEGESAWAVYAFKERTAFPERAPAYVRGRMTRKADGSFELKVHGDRGYPPLPASFVTRDHTRVASQADACPGPDGAIWILDRWRRQIHRAVVRKEDESLALAGSFDYLDVVEGVAGETSPAEPAPPGLPERRGYGRHEALTFDADGRIYLGSDRGSGRPSTVSVLASRTKR